MDLELPGIPNIHCHAFQRAMAGLAERQSERQDSFWTWRELMYRFAGRVGPESLRDIAAQLYVEMLEAGYTACASSTTCTTRPTGVPTRIRPRCRRR
jgi:formimidoylglutamate deiminase